MAKHRVIGIDFNHMHMGDQLRLVCDHPDAEVVGVWHSDSDKPLSVLRQLDLPESLLYEDWQDCMEKTRPTVAVLCSSTADHADWAVKIAQRGIHVLVEKPFAASLADADTMLQAAQRSGTKLAINWPLAWVPAHRTTKRLLDEGRIGEILNIHYYDGNRGPAHHKMDKMEVSGEELLKEKQHSWFYKKAAGGGSLQDYLGYGTTLATWFNNGQKPFSVTSVVDQPQGLEVDEHSVTVANYHTGLYKFETRWGTFTDPWTHQPQPKCGFVVCGTEGTISSYDYEPTVRVQTRDHPDGIEIPVDVIEAPHTDPITYFLHCLETGQELEGPLSPQISRIGQQIVDTALRSASEKRTIPLIDSNAAEHGLATTEPAALAARVDSIPDLGAKPEASACGSQDSYALKSSETKQILTLPSLNYLPPRAQKYQPTIGLIGCGGITAEHLTAYKNAGYRVAALVDTDRQKAVRRRDEFNLEADIYADAADLFARTDIDVVDLATHPTPRAQLLQDAIAAGKHVLSQKPFVLDLDFGLRVCDEADQRGVKLAVNQNGRWAPYVSWLRQAIAQGLIGEVASVDTLIAWDHTWVQGTPFENIPHLLLYDFAVHWFDMLHCYTPNQQAISVTAHVACTPGQSIRPPLLAQVSVQMERSQATLVFRGDTSVGAINTTLITGSQGTLRSVGSNLEDQTVTLSTAEGQGSPDLEGSWFPGGFDGTMSELVVAIEEGREPSNSGRDNLAALAICFAAIESAETGKTVSIGSVRKVKESWVCS